MIKKITEKELLVIIKNSLEVKAVSVNSSSKNLKEWDSLGQLNILSVLDKKLRGKLSLVNNISKADSVKKLIAILKKKSLLI